jgi:hypothetical protein
MKLKIDSPAGVLFCQKIDVTAADAITVFGSSFNVMCITY